MILQYQLFLFDEEIYMPFNFESHSKALDKLMLRIVTIQFSYPLTSFGK